MVSLRLFRSSTPLKMPLFTTTELVSEIWLPPEPEISTVGDADAWPSMMRPAAPAKSIAEIAVVVTLFRSKVPATTSMLKFVLLALVVRFLSSRVPEPVFFRMPALRAAS